MAYQTDEAGNSYYVPDAQVGGNRGDWDWGGSGLSTALSGAGTGAQIGSMFGGVPGALLGGLGGLALGGLYGAFTGGQELDRDRAAEAARIEAQKQARQRMEQAYADQQSALESQRQLAEQLNPAETIYGTQGRPGLLQMQQAQLAQQMAAQGARNRASLASRGLLGSGMEAATSGAIAGQQAGQQAQLQASAIQQYQQQQAARQQQLGQLGMQSAQLSRELAGARSQMDQAALAGQQQQAQQIAQRNQQLIQAGLQGVSAGLGAYQQAQALQAQRDMVNLYRKQMGLPELPAQAAPFAEQAEAAKNWLGNAGADTLKGLQQGASQAAQGIGQFGQGAMSALGQLGQGAISGLSAIQRGYTTAVPTQMSPLMPLSGPPTINVMGGAMSPTSPLVAPLPTVRVPQNQTPGFFDKPTYPPLETLPAQQPRRSQRQSAASGLMFG